MTEFIDDSQGHADFAFSMRLMASSKDNLSNDGVTCATTTSSQPVPFETNDPSMGDAMRVVTPGGELHKVHSSGYGLSARRIGRQPSVGCRNSSHACVSPTCPLIRPLT